MTLQKPRTAESFATDVARVLEIVRENVHGQSWHTDVNLVAMGTFLGILAVQGPMGLFVAGQIRGCCIVFSTFIACIPNSSI